MRACTQIDRRQRPLVSEHRVVPIMSCVCSVCCSVSQVGDERAAYRVHKVEMVEAEVAAGVRFIFFSSPPPVYVSPARKS